MLQILKSYLKFLYNSTNQHGVHSPFVFDLVTKCFYDTFNYPAYSILKKYRNSLLQNKNFIEVTDFGAGSRVFKSNKRQVSQIAKNAGISSKRAELLFRLVNYFQPENILEIGTSLGLGTSALSLGLVAKTNRAKLNQNGKVTTLEGCPNTLAVSNKMFQVSSFKFPSHNIEFVNTEFEDYLKNFQLPTPDSCRDSFQLIYFDGNHSKSATLNYFESLLPTITNDSIWIFDDIHWSKDMEEAWEIIKNHPKVTVTIDTFEWGIVFFRTQQEKENFTIRA